MILTELLPLLIVKKENEVAKLLKSIKNNIMHPDWEEIIAYQVYCWKSGSTGIGIPDLLISQNSIQNNIPVYSIDKHFKFMHKANIGIELYV